MYPNPQAYDRGVMFNPDGRLFQVEYAREAVRKGGAALGMVVDSGVLFVAHKNIDEPLAVLDSLEKVFYIDSHIGATYSGIQADALHLIDVARQSAQTHRLIYDEVKSVAAITKEISEYILQATFYGGVRPYGISVLIGGIDNKPRLFMVDPGAALLGYKAVAVGNGAKTANEMLEKEYKADMPIDAAIGLGIKIIKKINEGKISSELVDIGYVTDKNAFKVLKPEEAAEYF
ncbi:MAG: archaeal proteasome endopeptidase complex subunit alpha [Candidatus Micrarchaeaceae archaeon]